MAMDPGSVIFLVSTPTECSGGSRKHLRESAARSFLACRQHARHRLKPDRKCVARNPKPAIRWRKILSTHTSSFRAQTTISVPRKRTKSSCSPATPSNIQHESSSRLLLDDCSSTATYGDTLASETSSASDVDLEAVQREAAIARTPLECLAYSDSLPRRSRHQGNRRHEFNGLPQDANVLECSTLQQRRYNSLRIGCQRQTDNIREIASVLDPFVSLPFDISEREQSLLHFCIRPSLTLVTVC